MDQPAVCYLLAEIMIGRRLGDVSVKKATEARTTSEGGRLLHVGSLKRRFGSVEYSRCESPPALVVRASGWIGPPLLLGVLERLDSMSKETPNGWIYVADVRRVLAPSMRNLRYLKRIHGVQGLRTYVVVATGLGRLVLGLARRLPGGPDDVVTSVEAALSVGLPRA